MEDSTPEEQCADPDTPDTPVGLLLCDQQAASEDALDKTPINEIPYAPSPNLPADLVLNPNCPLSEKLRELRLETRGWDCFILLFFRGGQQFPLFALSWRIQI